MRDRCENDYGKKDRALCAERPAEHLTAETDWTQLCAEAESVSADEQTAAYLEADEMDFASDAGEAPAADSSTIRPLTCFVRR